MANPKMALGLPNTGKSDTFAINTAGVPRCGYNVWIVATDRIIINSIAMGFRGSDVQGFCLKPNTAKAIPFKHWFLL